MQQYEQAHPWHSTCSAGPPLKERAKAILPFVVLAVAYTQMAHLPLEQILNGAIAAVLFNIIYDTLLSRKLRWFAMCPVIDSMNHQSTSTVRLVTLLVVIACSIHALNDAWSWKLRFICRRTHQNKDMFWEGLLQGGGDVKMLPGILLQAATQHPNVCFVWVWGLVLNHSQLVHNTGYTCHWCR